MSRYEREQVDCALETYMALGRIEWVLVQSVFATLHLTSRWTTAP